MSDPRYRTARWQRIRAAQLHAEPLCRMCSSEGRITAANTADHIIPHKGDDRLFWDAGNLQSLCGSCHSSDKQSIERGGKPRPRIALDGWPIE